MILPAQSSMTTGYATAPCTLGSFLVASGPRGIVAILLGDDPATLARQFEQRSPHARNLQHDQGFNRLIERIARLISAPAEGHDLLLDPQGTPFQRRVWEILMSVPAGTTISYQELARRAGTPRAVRAVASACARNAIAVAIPCHRIVRSDGRLSGYRWGIGRKQSLLDSERDAPPAE